MGFKLDIEVITLLNLTTSIHENESLKIKKAAL